MRFMLLLSYVWYTFCYTKSMDKINMMPLTADNIGPPIIPSNSIYINNPEHKYNPNWYVVKESCDIIANSPCKISLLGSPISIWKNKYNQYASISDVCPHRGASLSSGRIDPQIDCIVCPYHTFKFNKYGRLLQTPGQKTLRMNNNYNFKTDVPHYPIVEKNGWVYILNKPMYDIDDIKYHNKPDTIWTEPEADNDMFKCVYLTKKFQQDARTVTENSLDILHIAEVHSFGNKKRPLPITDKLEKIDEGHWKCTYQYEAGEDSIPSRMFGIKSLIVENEYILPHTTIARVKFGSFVNTIVTSALPVTQTETILFVKAYRNNWVFNIPMLDMFFDKLTKKMMRKTLGEDKSVVDTIYSKFRDGNFITKYDELVRLYREDYSSIVDRINTM